MFAPTASSHSWFATTKARTRPAACYQKLLLLGADFRFYLQAFSVISTRKTLAFTKSPWMATSNHHLPFCLRVLKCRGIVNDDLSIEHNADRLTHEYIAA